MSEREPSISGQVIEEAVNGFWSEEERLSHGFRKPHSIYDAAQYAVQSKIRALGISPLALAVDLVHHASITPNQVKLLDALGHERDREEYFTNLARHIVIAQMVTQDPKISAEHERRQESCD